MSSPTLKDWQGTVDECLKEAIICGDKLHPENDAELLGLLANALVGIAQRMPDGGLGVVEGLCAYTDFAEQVQNTFGDAV